MHSYILKHDHKSLFTGSKNRVNATPTYSMIFFYLALTFPCEYSANLRTDVRFTLYNMTFCQ